MKTIKQKLAVAMAVVMAMFAFTSCSDTGNTKNVPTAVKEAFNKQFPNAVGVDWEKHDIYYKADFEVDGMDADAWYTNAGEWQLTTKEVMFANLPDAVKTTFNSLIYAQGVKAGCYIVDRKDFALNYLIDVNAASTSVSIYFVTDGTVLYELQGGSIEEVTPIIIPTQITTYIKTNFPNASMVGFSTAYGIGGSTPHGWDIKILQDMMYKDIIFDNNFNHLYDYWDVAKADVPVKVSDAFKNSIHSGKDIIFIRYYDNPAPKKDYYVYRVFDGTYPVSPTDITIDADGTIVVPIQ